MVKRLTKHGNSLALVIERGVLDLLRVCENISESAPLWSGGCDYSRGHFSPMENQEVTVTPACRGGAGRLLAQRRFLHTL